MQNVKIIILTKKDLKADAINLAASEVEFANFRLSRKDRSQAHIIVFQQGTEIKILKSLYYSEECILSFLSSKPYEETQAEIQMGKAVYAPVSAPRLMLVVPESSSMLAMPENPFMFTGGSRKLATFRQKSDIHHPIHYEFLTETRRLLTFSEPE